MDLAFQQASFEFSGPTGAALALPHASFAAPAGSYLIGFGIVGQQPSFDPALTISNLAFAANGPTTPEPATMWLTLPVLLGGIALRKLRRA